MNNLIRSNDDKFTRYWLKKYNLYCSLYNNYGLGLPNMLMKNLYNIIMEIHEYLENKYGLFFHT